VDIKFLTHLSFIPRIKYLLVIRSRMNSHSSLLQLYINYIFTLTIINMFS